MRVLPDEVLDLRQRLRRREAVGAVLYSCRPSCAAARSAQPRTGFGQPSPTPPTCSPQWRTARQTVVDCDSRQMLLPVDYRAGRARGRQRTRNPRIGPRPAAPIRATARAEGRFEHGPLDVGEVHAVEYDGDPTDVSVDAARLSGQPFSEVRAAERPCAKHQQQATYNNEYEGHGNAGQEMRQRIRFALEEQSIHNSHRK